MPDSDAPTTRLDQVARLAGPTDTELSKMPARRLPDADDHEPAQLKAGEVQYNRQMMSYFARTPNDLPLRLNSPHALYHEPDGTLTVQGLIAVPYDPEDKGRSWYGFYERDTWREATGDELAALGIVR